MNISEAHAWNLVVRHFRGSDTRVTSEALDEAVELLATKAQKALAAGPAPHVVVKQFRKLDRLVRAPK